MDFLLNELSLHSQYHSERDFFESLKVIMACEKAIKEAGYHLYCSRELIEPSDFNGSPLEVVWHQSNGVEKAILVQNLWQLATLTQFLKKSVKPAKSWNDLINQCIKRYSNLTFADNLLDSPEPFSGTIAERVQVLLSYLNELNACFGENGQLNKRGKEIIKTYFQGTKALFTDESETNKQHFKDALTFRKPHTDEKIFCPFHGKIKAGRQYRIHFNWPKEKPTEPLYIVYIGPKITKH
jgi:hypothetical protein